MHRSKASRWGVLVLLALAAPWAAAQTAPSRAELLYGNHCIACHTTQIHWRDKRAARDWSTLVVFVERWQRNERLAWEAQDVVEVARFLNARYYRYPEGN